MTTTAKNPQDKIVSCRITGCTGFGHDHKIMAKFDLSDVEEEIYSFYCDEKSYDAASFVGMTREAASNRVRNDDGRYLQSSSRHMSF